MMTSRYAHAKQFKRHHRQLRLLRSRLGRIIRDIQDHRTARARGGLRSADRARCADPIATAAPAWMEALFLPRPEVECIIYEGMRIAGLPEG